MQPGPCRSEWPALLPNAMVAFEPELQLRAVSGSVSLLQPASVLPQKTMQMPKVTGHVGDEDHTAAEAL